MTNGIQEVQVGISQIVAIAASAMQLLGLARQIRDQFRADNPDVELPAELSDEALIADLKGDADALIAKAARLAAKYADPVPPAA